jgi:molybdopterin/thiamine biosynthesis adenylyltransferase
MMTISPEENLKLKDFKVCVVGCGGLGGYVIEMLGRLGIGHITAVDGDVFDESNLNRQLLSSEKVIGNSKAEVAKSRMAEVNSEIEVTAIRDFLTAENWEKIVNNHDLVIDALDNISARKVLANGCRVAGIPMIHGAIAGWYGQVSTIMPGDETISLLYSHDEEKGIETELGNPSFTPALVASIETAEALKVLLGRGEVLSKKVLSIDLLNQEYEIFEL